MEKRKFIIPKSFKMNPGKSDFALLARRNTLEKIRPIELSNEAVHE